MIILTWDPQSVLWHIELGAVATETLLWVGAMMNAHSVPSFRISERPHEGPRMKFSTA